MGLMKQELEKRLDMYKYEMYEVLTDITFIPDCGGDFCFLATEGMENEYPEDESFLNGSNCKHKGYCRWANALLVKRDNIVAKIEGGK